MGLFRFTLLLLVQLSSIYVHVNGETVYECKGKQIGSVTVLDASAQLTNGCALEGNGITFDLESMYKAKAASKTAKTPKTAVGISISEAAFINSYIKLINGDNIPDDISAQVPLLFTMSQSNISGTSSLEFGVDGKVFKIPPNSRISIVDSQLTILSSPQYSYMFTFYSLQLVTQSSIEISRNVITMECKGCNIIAVFYLPPSAGMMIFNGSSFTLKDNVISLEANNAKTSSLTQHIWYQNKCSLTISLTSYYTWVSNIISMVGSSGKLLNQNVWHQHSPSPLTISQSSNFTWLMNTISMNALYANYLYQNLYNQVISPLTISDLSQFLFETNKVLMLAMEYKSIRTYLIYTQEYRTGGKSRGGSTISGGSSMVWKDNCVGMLQKEGDKRYVLGGKWSITDKGSKLLLDGNYITTTEKYENSSELTQLMWGHKNKTEVTINNAGILIIRNTKVHGNSAGSATGSMVWDSSLFTSEVNDRQPDMKWSSSGAKDSSGSSIPTLDNSNLQQYTCVAYRRQRIPGTTRPAVKSPTAILSTIPAVMITSVVLIYFFI